VQHLSKLHNPVYLFILFGLVAFLSGTFSGLGTEGITFLVVGSVVAIIATPIAFKALRKQWKKMLSGKPSKLDFMAAPAGYRRARYAESEQEYIAQTAVIPTPNRPLITEEKTPGIDFNFQDAPTVEASQEVLEYAATHRTIDAPHRDLASLMQGRSIGSRAIESPKPPKNDPSNPRLNIAPECQPHINDIIGHSICGFGIRGSGKTTLAARLIEQIGLLPNVIPMAIFDDCQDYASLPEILPHAVIAGIPEWTERWRYQDYYWDVTEENAEEIGYLILEDRIQLILQIHTYPSLEEAARIMCSIIKGMFAWADERDPSKRVPCMVFLDEAQRYLPQDRSVSPIAQEETLKLARWFDALNSIGRKKGFTPALFTLRPAQVLKPAIVGSEIYLLGLQTFPADLKYYEEITGKDKLSRDAVQRFKPGQFALFEGGEVAIIHVYPRQSEHRGTTPSYAQAGHQDNDRSVVTKKIRSVQTVNFNEGDIDEQGQDIDSDEGYPFSPSRNAGSPPETPIISEKTIVLGKDPVSGKVVSVTKQEYDIAVRLRKFGPVKGYRDLMEPFDLSEHHAKALNKLILIELGLRESESD